MFISVYSSHTHTNTHCYICEAFTLACVYFSSHLSTVTQSLAPTSTYFMSNSDCGLQSELHMRGKTNTHAFIILHGVLYELELLH